MATGSDSSSGRWWEYYVVRYLAGTVIGGLVLAQVSMKCSKLALNAGASSSLEALLKSFTLLAALSFAYCYIASAPMLTLHAARVLLKRGTLPVQNFHRWILLCLCLCLTGIFMAFISHQKDKPFAWPFLLGFFFVSLIQTLFVYIALLASSASTAKFYKQVVEMRARRTSKVEEFSESYRHLREHANAYAIILLELILAPAFVWNCEAKWIITVLFMWLLPPALCWGIATRLELEFVLSPEDFPSDEVDKN